MSIPKAIESTTNRQREFIIRVLSAASFLICFQAYMEALLIFGAVEFLAALAAIPLYRSEKSSVEVAPALAGTVLKREA